MIEHFKELRDLIDKVEEKPGYGADPLEISLEEYVFVWLKRDRHIEKEFTCLDTIITAYSRGYSIFPCAPDKL